MSKKPKPATAGEKISGDVYPEGTIDHAICRRRLSRRIDAAIRRAVTKERYRCALLLTIHQDGNATLEETKAAIEQGVGA